MVAYMHVAHWCRGRLLANALGLMSLQLDFIITCTASPTSVPLISAVRRIQGQLPESGRFESLTHPAGQRWREISQASPPAMPPERLQDSLWRDFFSDPKQWWDDRRIKPTPQHPDFRHKKSKVALWVDYQHKPAWVDFQLATWDSSMKKPAESISSAIQEQGAYCSLGHQDNLEVGMCLKLCEDGRISDAVDALNRLVQRRCHLDNSLFYLLLKKSISNRDLVVGRRIHGLAIQGGYGGDSFLATHLISLYASHGMLKEAMQVFTKVSTPDAYNWATIIFAYAEHGVPAEAIRLYRQMCKSSTVMPTNCIFLAVLKACATAGDLAAGKDVHAHIIARSGTPDSFVQTGLVNMYAKCGSLEDARGMFDRHTDKNVVTWTAMMAGYAEQGMGQEALSLYASMQQEGITTPNSVTFVCLLQACAIVGFGALNQGKQLHSEIEERGLQDDVVLGGSLVNMYAKCGSLADAQYVFDRLQERDVITWTVMIACYAQHGMGLEAVSLYSSMQHEGISIPNSVTFVCLLQACAGVAALPWGKQLHADIEERGLQADPDVGAALVNMYAKCGSMLRSQQVFDSLPQKNIEAWGALTDGYCHQGDSEVVFDLVDRMRREGVQPDSVTFLSVLTVCSHVGLVNKGQKYFEAMRSQYGVSPTLEHYTCMMDLLGRAGRLDEALQMARTMPFPADAAVWLTLLGACRKWCNVEIGQQVFEYAVSVDVTDAASYVLMSNIYASAEMWESSKEMQVRRMKCGAWKKPGQSWWIDMIGVEHTFVVGDKKLPENESVCGRLGQLVPKLERQGMCRAVTVL